MNSLVLLALILLADPKTAVTGTSAHRFHGSDAWCDKRFDAVIVVVLNIIIVMLIDGMDVCLKDE